jgi:hypothetical protein
MKTKSDDEILFKVIFRDPEDMKTQLTLLVREVSDSSLGLSFVSLSGFVFNNSVLIYDHKNEQLKKRFQNTKKLHLSIYNIISIEEVGEDEKGLFFHNDRSNILVLNKNFDI